eukprot:624431-Pleurochrysis_carterae.AAC.1
MFCQRKHSCEWPFVRGAELRWGGLSHRTAAEEKCASHWPPARTHREDNESQSGTKSPFHATAVQEGGFHKAMLLSEVSAADILVQEVGTQFMRALAVASKSSSEGLPNTTSQWSWLLRAFVRVYS